MSFYVYLPSNVKHIEDKFLSAEDGDKSLNTTSNYTTQLIERKYFRVPYEVAVVDVTFMHSWRIPIGKLTVDFRQDIATKMFDDYNIEVSKGKDFKLEERKWRSKTDLELTETERVIKRLFDFELSDEGMFKVFDIYIYDGEDIQTFLERVELDIENYYLQLIINNRYKLYNELKNTPKFKFNPELYSKVPYDKSKIDHLDPLIVKIKKEPSFRALPRFFSGFRGWKVDTGVGVQIKFSGLVCRLLKMPKDILIQKKRIQDTSSFESILDLPRTLRLTQLLFIYTDIIKDQLVGNSRSALIRTVHVDNDHLKGAYVSFQFPQYFPVNATEIDSINIRITDETGTPVHFVDAVVAVTLHFRPIQRN
jgi:hypothetical protein